MAKENGSTTGMNGVGPGEKENGEFTVGGKAEDDMDQRPVSAVTQTGVVLAPGTLAPTSDRMNRYKENGSTAELSAASSADTLAESRRNREPLRLCKWITSYPKLSFAITLSLHLLMFLIVVILIIAGKDVIPFKLDSVDLDLRDDLDNRREMAWSKRHDHPGLISRSPWFWEGDDEEEEDGGGGRRGGGRRRGPRAAGDDPGNGTIGQEPPHKPARPVNTQTPRDMLQMFFLEEDGNVFTQENMKRIKDVEDAFVKLPDFEEYCMKDATGKCQKGTCILRLFEMMRDPNFERIPSVLHKANTTKQMKQQLQYFLGKNAAITETSATSEITRCSMQLAYSSKLENKTKDEQSKDFERYMMRVVKPLADKYYKDKIGPMEFIYSSGTILSKTILNMVYKDAAMIFLSLIFIFIFMSIQTQSLWITCFALLSIITGFCTANLLYRYILGYVYIGPFHALAVFIILGIGADDIFIFLDTWKAAGHQPYPSVAHRLSDTYRKASLAMLFTSLTTAIAFMVGAASPFLGITTFGVFSGVLVLVNYLSVIIFFPCVVVTYHFAWEKYRCCCCCAKQEMSISDENVNGGSKKRKNPIVRFFRGPYYQLITHKIGRWVILLIYTGLIIFFIYFASRIKIKEDQIQFVKENSNLGRYISLSSSAFKNTNDDYKVKVTLAWGLQPQDVSGCDSQKADCEGKMVWDSKFDLNKNGTQEAMLKLCRTLRGLPQADLSKMAIATDILTEEPEIDCFMEHIYNFTQVESNRQVPDENNVNLTRRKYPLGDALSIPVNSQVAASIINNNNKVYTVDVTQENGFDRFFELGSSLWMYNGFNFEQSDWKAKKEFETFTSLVGEAEHSPYTVNNTNMGFDFHYGTKLVFAGISVNTTMTFNMGFPTGHPIRDAWEDFLTKELGDMPEALKGGFQTCNVWPWLNVQKKLSDTAVTGIIVGVCISLPILILATMNVWTGLLATLTICCTTMSVVGVIPLAGWKLGVIESVNMVLVVGLSVDYVVHLAEGYSRSHHPDRLGRTRDSLEEVGISVLSGAVTSLGSSVFLLVASVIFFAQFGAFVFCTIFLSLAYGLGLFPTVLALVGPQNEFGSLRPLFRKCFGKCKKN